ncbi:MAG: hypothetical protein AAF529_11855 [Pseudomonadota bacterium]
MKATRDKQIEVTLYRNGYTRTAMLIQLNGDLVFVRYEPASDDQLRIKSDRAQVLASLAKRSGHTAPEVEDSDAYLAAEIQALFRAASADPFGSIVAFFEDNGIDFELSNWGNH